EALTLARHLLAVQPGARLRLQLAPGGLEARRGPGAGRAAIAGARRARQRGRAGSMPVGVAGSSVRRQAWSGPAPPKATSAKRRGSWPRPTDTVRMARAIELSMISKMPGAALHRPRRGG